MKNTIGSGITLTLFGESHGEYVGAVLDGIAPGITVDREYVSRELAKRRPAGRISTARVEADEFVIASGVYEGKTTGTPLCILIPNTNKKSGDYATFAVKPRPGHADYTAHSKYGGYQDPRGGGHFSGRITAAIVAAGAILRPALERKGIFIGTHISALHGIKDRDFDNYRDDIDLLNGKYFPALCEEAEAKMTAEAEKAAFDGDSVGGVLETAVVGMPAGVGEPWFDTVEGVISHWMFSIPAIKGVEFGRGFGFSDLYGSEANDPFAYKDGEVITLTNNNGGINGGITNGMPIIFRCAVKPTPSVYKEQNTVDLDKGCDSTLRIEGRHDPAIIHRARAVVDAAATLALADMLTVRYGTNYLSEADGK